MLFEHLYTVFTRERTRLRDRNAELVAVLEVVADRAEGEWRGYSKEAALHEIAALLRAAAQEAS